MRILVVDDQVHLNESISDVLKLEGYQVDSVFNGQDAVDYILSVDYDCVVLDIMMPGLDGFEVVRSIRASNNPTPILFLSAKTQLQDRIKALKLGGDDYLMKPFSMEELLMRIHVLIRRQQTQGTPLYKNKHLKLNIETHQVWVNEIEVNLSQKEYQILNYLIKNQDKVCSRDQILNHVWDFDYEGTSNIVDVYMYYLRQKIDKDQKEILIETIRGFGYMIRSQDEKSSF